MEDEELKQVQEYLHSRGFQLTELALQEEQARLSTVLHPGVSLDRSLIEDPSRFQDAYNSLRTWIYGSLEPYKEELLKVLYPVFVQCLIDLLKGGNTIEAEIFFNSFLKDHQKAHSTDLHKMKRILSLDSQDMDLTQTLRGEKFRVELCQNSYELLLGHLHREKALVMLEVINEGMIFKGTIPNICWATFYFICCFSEAVAEMVKTGSASALVGISALNVIASKVSECRRSGFLTTAVLYSLPYTYLPVGLVSAALGVGATRNHRLLGTAASFLLAQFLYIFIIGGVRAIACGDKMFTGFVGTMTILSWVWLVCNAILFGWGFMSEYPKCLHLYVRRHIAFLRRCFFRAAQADVNSGREVEADVEMGVCRENRDEVAQLAQERPKNQ